MKINLVLLGLLGFLGYMYIGRGILTGETVFAPSRWISVEGLISTLGETKVEITNRKLSSLPDVSFNLEGGNLLESLKSGNFPTTRIFLLSAAQKPWGGVGGGNFPAIYFCCSDGVAASGVFGRAVVRV